jgi:uncharacterized spore protein YtfJ
MTQSVKNNAAVLDAIREVVDHASAGTVFGQTISQDGVTVLPVAKVSGGAGGGSGPEIDQHPNSGIGGGLGLSARPLGAFVIREGRVSWRPAIDLNRVILGGQLVAIVALLVVRSLVRNRRRGQ